MFTVTHQIFEPTTDYLHDIRTKVETEEGLITFLQILLGNGIRAFTVSGS